MKLIEKPRTMKVTSSFAKIFAGMETIPNDRPLSEKRLMVYRKAIEQGLFRPVSWATCYCKETNTTYRINGKHTSTLLASLPTIPDFYVVIEKYTANTLKEVVELYNTFDSKTQSRTAKDINHSFASVSPELRDLPSSIIDICIGGINYGELQDKMYTVQPVERAEKILDHVDFVLWLYEELYKNNTTNFKPLIKTGVVGAIFLTYKRNEADATRFWQAVRDETGTLPTLPDRKLARFITRTRATSTHSKDKLGGATATTHEFFIKSLHAWNAWRKGVDTSLRYYPETITPKVI